MRTLPVRDRRDPFAGFDALFRRIGGPATGRGFVPAAEVGRDGDDAVVRVELPGLDAERDAVIEVDGNRLVVRGERRDEHRGQYDPRRLREVRYGAFRRSFELPAPVSADAVTASYDAGVLTVRVSGAHAGDRARQPSVSSSFAPLLAEQAA